MGFGSSSAFGEPCETLVAEKLAANGLKFTRPHTCALCSPTQQAMETPEFMLSKIDEFGLPSASNHCAVGWAWATNAPYQWSEQVAPHWDGTRKGTIVQWPRGIKERGGRRQFRDGP